MAALKVLNLISRGTSSVLRRTFTSHKISSAWQGSLVCAQLLRTTSCSARLVESDTCAKLYRWTSLRRVAHTLKTTDLWCTSLSTSPCLASSLSMSQTTDFTCSLHLRVTRATSQSRASHRLPWTSLCITGSDLTEAFFRSSIDRLLRRLPTGRMWQLLREKEHSTLKRDSFHQLRALVTT